MKLCQILIKSLKIKNRYLKKNIKIIFKKFKINWMGYKLKIKI